MNKKSYFKPIEEYLKSLNPTRRIAEEFIANIKKETDNSNKNNDSKTTNAPYSSAGSPRIKEPEAATPWYLESPVIITPQTASKLDLDVLTYVPAQNASFQNVNPEAVKKEKEQTAKSIGYYSDKWKESGFKNDFGIYSHEASSDYYKKSLLRDVPITDFDDKALVALVNDGVFDFEKMKKAGLGPLVAYIQTVYWHYNDELYRVDKPGIGDNLSRAVKFLSKTKDSAGKTIEGFSRGVVNAGASAVDLVVDSPKIDNFIKNNVVKENELDELKYSFMPEKQKKAADLIGSSIQLVPLIAANTFVPGSGLVLMGTSVYGNAYADARRKGASEGQAAFNGLLKASAEVLIEKYLAGGVPTLGSGGLTKVTEKVVRLFGNEYLQKFARVLFEAGGEGTEEVLSYLVEPWIDKMTNIPGAKIEYDIKEAAYNWLGGSIGSFIFNGGSVTVGYDNSPAPEAFAKAKKAVDEFKSTAFHNGLNDAKTQKAIDKVEKSVKEASFYNTETQKYEIPPSVAELITAGKTIRRNPNTLEAQDLIEKYSGVGNTKVIRNDALKQLLKDKKISRRELAAMDALAYKLGVNIDFTDDLGSGNGNFDIAYTNKNEPVVVLKDNVFYDDAGNKKQGKPHEVIEEYIVNQVGKSFKIEESGQWVFIGDDLPGEYTQSEYTRKFLLKHRNLLNVKNQSSQNFKEIIEIASDRKWSKNTKSKHNIDAKYGFYKYTSKVALPVKNISGDIIGSNIYDIELLIRNDADGKKYLYDIQNIRKNTNSALASTQIFESAIEKQNGVPSNKNISQNNRIVNGEYSADGKTIKINVNSTDPFFETVLHESIHAIFKGDGTSLSELANNLYLAALADDEAFGDIRKDIFDKYSGELSGNEAHDNKLLYEEFTAKMLSVILDNPQTLKTIARKNMNVFERLYDSIVGFFDGSIKRYIEKDNAPESIYDVAAQKLEDYKDRFLSAFEGELDGYYRFDNYKNSYNTLFSTADPFNKVVDKVLAPGSTYNQYVYVGRTEKLLRKCGFDNIPVLMTPGHIRDINTPKSKNKPGESRFHGLTDAQIKHIPEMLKNPVMIYDSISPNNKENTVCVLTNEFDGDGNPIIVVFKYVEGIEKNVPSHCVMETQNYNMVSTQYGKDSFYNHLQEIIENDSVLYANKSKMEKFLNNKTLNLSTGNKIQFLETLNKLGFDRIIHQSRNLVNVKNNQNSDNGTGSLNNMAMKSVSNIQPSEDISLHQSINGDNLDIDNSEPFNIENRNTRSKRIFEQSRKQYGLEPDVVYGDDISLNQSDIDERLGRSFNIPDEKTLKTQTDVKDMKNNSLHFSDNVVFSVGEGADISYGTGRIIDFVSRGNSVNAVVSVDSGDVKLTEVEVPAEKLIFTSHNNSDTISNDFKSSNSMYARAKAAFESQLLSNNENIKGFSFSDVQYYLGTSSERLGILLRKFKSRQNGYDEGIATSHNLNPSSEDFEFDRYTQHELGMQLYDAVRNYNMAKKLSEIYTSRNSDFVGIDEIALHIRDKDNMFSFKDNVYANGNYMFNDVYRNFERVFGNYYDFAKPLLDNFDRAKGKYARSIFMKAEEVSGLYAKCGIEIGSIEDAAVQMLGEGIAHFDLKNKNHKRLFKEMGFDESLVSGNTADVLFNMQTCAKIFGEEKALQIKECADYFRAMYDEYLTRANEVIARIYPGQEQRLIHPREDYFRHFSEISDGLYGVAQSLAEDIQIDPMLVGKTDRTKPNRSWESIWQERKSKTTDYSAFKGFADYIPHAEYTININPFIKEFREFGQLLAEAKAQRGQTDLNSFINYIDKFSNHIAKKTVGFDRMLTDFFGRDGRRILNGLAAANNVVMKNAILGNASVSIKQILNLKNGLVYLQKPSLLINSTTGLLKAYTEDNKLLEHYESLMDMSDYLAERFLDVNFADKKSGAKKIAEKMASIGDEFAVRAIWLAAYEDGLRLGCDDAVRYADDIARRCSAGRGIGEKPLAFTQQISKLVLPFLLENNNNWNVLRDAFGSSTKAKNDSAHQFSDNSSYSFYKNKGSNKTKFVSNSFKLALYLIATLGVGELIEELTGYQAEFNPLNDISKGFKKAVKDNGELDFEAFCNGIGNSLKNLGTDFIEHRNLGWVYSMALGYLSDNPLSATNDFFGSVPVVSAIGSAAKKAIKDNDYIGAGLDLVSSFATPYGGNQVRKSINGAVDFFQGGNYKNAPTLQLQNSILDKFNRGGAIKGEKQYEIEKTPENLARGLLFGQSSFPEAQEYYNSKAEGKKVDNHQESLENKAFAEFRKNAKSPEYDEFFRVWHSSGNYGALPYRYISPTLEFTSESGKDYSVELTDAQLKKYQDKYNSETKKKYLEISKTDEYKKASDKEKAKLLSDAGNKIYNSLLKNMKSDIIGEEFAKQYISKYGEDEIIKAYKQSGYNSDFVPHYDFKAEKEFTLNGVKTKFSLTEGELKKYTELADEQIREEYKKIISDPLWKIKDMDKRSAALLKAKEKVTDKISEYIKWDYVYKDAMNEFDVSHGEDNTVRKAYEYSHDATVYPYWELNKTISFTHNKKSVVYELNDEEYAHWSERINRNLQRNFDDFISRGSLNGKSVAQCYDILSEYKDIIIKKGVNPALKSFVLEKGYN